MYKFGTGINALAMKRRRKEEEEEEEAFLKVKHTDGKAGSTSSPQPTIYN
jgi:hypothetical protein